MYRTALIFTLILNCIISTKVHSQSLQLVPVRGLCIAAPTHSGMAPFMKYIVKEVASSGVNTLILRIDYNFEFTSHPELQHPDVFRKADAKALYDTCSKLGIKIIPLINLFGHQSWASKMGKLLEVYPQFDETPDIKLPEKYEWPNSDSLYCKSYCPLHPDLHKVLFDLIDEVMNAFHADAFHAGMDEVIYIGHKDCRRCHRKDRVELFADEVKRIHDHLTERNARMWMWGDRLLDGHTTGIGFWEASYNGTDPAIDRIPKDIVICDWHYDRPEPTAAYFALKGFDVVSCSWKKSDVGIKQLDYIRKMRRDSSYPITTHLLGEVQTIWTQTNIFLAEIYNTPVAPNHNQLQIGTGLNRPASTDETEQEAFKKLAAEWLKEK